MARPFVRSTCKQVRHGRDTGGIQEVTGGYSRWQEVTGGIQEGYRYRVTPNESAARGYKRDTGGYRGYRGHSRFQVATSRFQAAERCPSRGPRPRRSAMGYRRIQRFQATAGVTGGYNAVFVGDKRLQWDTEVTAARPLSPTGYKAGTPCLSRMARPSIDPTRVVK